MMRCRIRGFLLLSSFLLILVICRAQNRNQPPAENKYEIKQSPKPFRVFTNGREVTIRSTGDIKNIMLWTTGGDRVVEQRDIQADNYTFQITINGKIFFLMVGMADGRTYTQKIGIQ